MAVTLKDVDYVAALARLSFTAGERELLVQQLNEILLYMEKLNELDTAGVEPLAHMTEPGNVLRDDGVVPSYPPEEMLKNAPSRTEKFFAVPKVIGDSSGRS